jgi:hypothetical protein
MNNWEWAALVVIAACATFSVVATVILVILMLTR